MSALEKLVACLRSSAEAFRIYPVYDSEGGGVLLTVQADECDQAATILAQLLDPPEALVEAIALALWQEDARRAAPNVLKGRTLEVFHDGTIDTVRAIWKGFARAALTTLAQHLGEPR